MSETGKTQLLDVSKLGVEAAVARLVDHAVSISASDLFFVSNEQHLAVQARHLGMVRLISIIPHEVGRRVLSHIKGRASMDLTERRRPLDGRWIYTQDDGTAVDLRINTIPTIYGEDLAIRVLARDKQLFTLDNVGMTREQHDNFVAMVDSPGGLILITGPTGSGKTATLYAALMRLNDGKRKINTIEDPVEFAIDGLRQSQVNPAVDLGFADLLPSVLRQSPDVIMLGEIRDAETADTAVRAANSGHLVLATIHASQAPGAVQSMRGLGVHPHFLSTSLRGVVAQRLVRTLCPRCRFSIDLADAPHTFDEIRPWLAADEGKAIYAAKGCDACGMAGYAGRTGVYEVMPVTREIRELISEGRPTRDIRDKAVGQKMLQFRHAAMLKVARGLTSTEEVFRVIPSEHLLDD
jgi:type II secretory ATPase GspE/PulE/Tfp pilus assembly ATPase PilB-like protein